jgi:predicted phage tail protein
VQWLAVAALTAASHVGAAFFVWRAAAAGAGTAAILGAVLVAAGIWQLEPMVRLNYPRTFTPEEAPQGLLPG